MIEDSKGSLLWILIVTLVILIVAAAAVIKFMPKDTPPEPPPVVSRAKVPPPPPPASSPAPQTMEPAAPPAGEAQSADASPSPGPIPSPQANEGISTTDPKTAGAPPPSPAEAKATAEETVMPLAPPPAPAPPPTAKAEPAPTPATQPEAAEKGPKAQNLARMDLDQMAPYAIQVGAFLNKSNADQVLSRLTQKGYAPFIFQVTDAQQRSFYMVRFGHFGSREEAAKTLEGFKRKEKMDAVIVRSGMM